MMYYLYLFSGRELAFRMPSTQSSIYEESVGEHLANDGSIIDDAISTCSATDISTNPFWQVDLGRVYSIFRIIIYNIDDLETRGKNTFYLNFNATYSTHLRMNHRPEKITPFHSMDFR